MLGTIVRHFCNYSFPPRLSRGLCTLCSRFVEGTILEEQRKVAGWISRSLANFPAAAGVIASVDSQSGRATTASSDASIGSSNARTYLIWFAHEHIEFRHAELQALIELFDAKLEFIGRQLEGRRLWLVDEGYVSSVNDIVHI